MSANYINIIKPKSQVPVYGRVRIEIDTHIAKTDGGIEKVYYKIVDANETLVNTGSELCDGCPEDAYSIFYWYAGDHRGEFTIEARAKRCDSDADYHDTVTFTVTRNPIFQWLCEEVCRDIPSEAMLAALALEAAENYSNPLNFVDPFFWIIVALLGVLSFILRLERPIFHIQNLDALLSGVLATCLSIYILQPLSTSVTADTALLALIISFILVGWFVGKAIYKRFSGPKGMLGFLPG